MYCLSLHNRNYEIIKELGYIPVGLGKDSFSAEWLTDKDGESKSDILKFASKSKAMSFEYKLKNDKKKRLSILKKFYN